MKQKIFKYSLAVAVLFSMFACSDFIEEENKVGETADLTYGTASGIKGLVGSCYSFARGWYGKEAGLGLSEMGTDLFYYGYDNKQKSLNSYNITAESKDGNTSDDAVLDHYWELFYSAVDVCNNAMVYIDMNDIIGDDLKSQYKGEVYFLRALYYHNMVNIWGPIPYNDSPKLGSITNEPKRASEEVIYSNILRDLDVAIASFEAAGYMTKADGRANYWSARALKARVLLYAGTWLKGVNLVSNSDYTDKNVLSLAQAEADAVISGSGASFYSNYSDTWTMANEDVAKNNETLFGIAYSDDLLTSVNCIPYRYRKDDNGDPLQYSSLITRTGYSRGGSAMLLQFVGMWNNGASDLGGDNGDVFVRAKNEGLFYLKHTVTGASVYVADTYSKYSRGFTRYLPSMYLWKLFDKYRATDQRTEGNLQEAYTIAPGLEGSSRMYPLMTDTAIYYCPLDGDSPEGKAKQAWAFQRYRIQFITGGEIPIYTSDDYATALPTETPLAKSTVYAGVVYKEGKRNRDTNAEDQYNSYKIGGWCSYPGMIKFMDDLLDTRYPTNDISYRDAAVLRLAEMYLIKAECQLYTGGDAMATINQLRAVRAISGQDNSLTGTATLETILDERALELCGEQQRWFDLKRTRTLVDRVKRYNKQGADNVTADHLLRPIPQAQMDAVLNYSTVPGEGFWQNKGY